MRAAIQRIANVRIGKADVKHTAPSHIRGVAQGNTTKLEKVKGVYPAGVEARCTQERSTGINPKDREPIDPETMPNLSPA